MINNIDYIIPLLNDIDHRYFYTIEIVNTFTDKKEVKINRVSEKYFIKGSNDLKKLMLQIKAICNERKEAAYIDINPKSTKKLQRITLAKLANQVCNNEIINPIYTTYSVAEKMSGKYNLYVINVNNISVKAIVLKWLDEYFNLEEDVPFCNNRNDLYLKGIIPTNDGIQIITKAFNIEEFHKSFSSIKVCKDCKVLLYCI